ncbi:MAG: ATP-binding protein [Bacteroidales bacterium]|nr:ATP-binding protein [Bacteroidales bacterium]
MMERKIDKYLLNWKNNHNRMPLIVRGARQVGKTYSIRQFGKTYKSFVEINFVTNPEYKQIFANGFGASEIVMQISLINPNFKFVENDTLIFFDEVQEYPDCTTCLKFFKQDGRYDVICSGSMMGLNYKEITSVSVGYKTDITMYSLDFEEFLWAKGYTPELIENIFQHLVEVKPFSQLEMDVLREKFLEYITVGGMPAIVSNFITSGNYSDTLAMQRQLLLDYENDITKYARGIDKAKIKNVYRNIPVFLAKENKKFQVTKVATHARSREYIGCVDWLNDAGIINICYCLSFPELPLRGNYDEAKYKIYFHDNGLLMASLDEYSLADLRQNKNLGIYKGAIYENVVAEAFVKSGLPTYYYKKENAQLEMDFFVRDTSSLVPVEVKAKDAATVSLNNLIKSDSYPDIKYGIKLCNKNVGFNGKFYTFPYFTAFLLKRWIDVHNG